MNDPDVVLCVDRNADGHAEQPLIGQRLGPQRIDLEERNLNHRMLRDRRAVQQGLAGHETDDAGGDHAAIHEPPPLDRIDHALLPLRL
jgi:hypothetical protein